MMVLENKVPQDMYLEEEIIWTNAKTNANVETLILSSKFKASVLTNRKKKDYQYI